MIEYVNGNFFDHDADIRINTVNCVGVIGAGVALQFKKKYPDMRKITFFKPKVHLKYGLKTLKTPKVGY